jgi:hypothetical protein
VPDAAPSRRRSSRNTDRAFVVNFGNKLADGLRFVGKHVRVAEPKLSDRPNPCRGPRTVDRSEELPKEVLATASRQ